MSVWCAGSNQTRNAISVTPQLPSHLVSHLSEEQQSRVIAARAIGSLSTPSTTSLPATLQKNASHAPVSHQMRATCQGLTKGARTPSRGCQMGSKGSTASHWLQVSRCTGTPTARHGSGLIPGRSVTRTPRLRCPACLSLCQMLGTTLRLHVRVVSQASYTFGLPAPRRAGWELLELINQHSCPTATKGRASDASEAVNTGMIH